MGWIGDAVDSVKSFQLRQALHQTISIGLIVTSALMIWKALMCVTGSESPVVVVVVLSESMEPGFARGDILFLRMSKDPIRTFALVFAAALPEKSNGYIRVDCYGGLNQMRRLLHIGMNLVDSKMYLMRSTSSKK